MVTVHNICITLYVVTPQLAWPYYMLCSDFGGGSDAGVGGDEPTRRCCRVRLFLQQHVVDSWYSRMQS
jgi:hypothetical protein